MKTIPTCRLQSLRNKSKLFLILLLSLLLLALLFFFRIFPRPDFLLTEEERFVKFTEEVFRNELCGSTLNLHYTVANPSAFGMDTEQVLLGNASLKARQQSCAALENYRNILSEFDYEKLSAKRQLAYDAFCSYLDTELSAAGLLLYDEPLSPTLGVQAQLPILLAEYTFRTKGDIEDYLCLLTQIPDYFSSILAFERDKSEAGLFMSSDCAMEVISQCQEFIGSGEDNYLIEIFDEKIDAVTNLTADEKIAYKTRNQSILSGYVIPAYEQLISGMGALEGSGVNDKGLYWLPEGKAYYQYLIKSMVGDNRQVEEIEEQIKTKIVEDFSEIQELAKQYTGQNEKSAAAFSYGTISTQAESESIDSAENNSQSSANNTSANTQQPTAMLNDLRQKITTDFPLLPTVSCSVKYVHDSLQEYLSPAFYLTPAIDDYENNVIYINPASDYNDLELYTTLAHEGYPGHLYQSVYFMAQDPDLLRCLLDIGGYTEGWATYVEMYSYSLWEGDSTLAALSQRNRSFTLGLASLLDIGIHYHGYSREDVTSFMEKLGFEASTAESLYQSILQAPGNYLQYYVGYLNFTSLRDKMQAELGSRFTLKQFHKAVLEAGPLPFTLLEREVRENLLL